jgi:hypothetical protein
MCEMKGLEGSNLPLSSEQSAMFAILWETSQNAAFGRDPRIEVHERDALRSAPGYSRGFLPETSYYPALAALFDTVGATLKPKVRCIVNPSHGAGIPDVGLFTPDQFQKASAAEPLPGTKPSRGVIEAKPTGDDAFLTAKSGPSLEILERVPSGPCYELSRLRARG